MKKNHLLNIFHFSVFVVVYIFCFTTLSQAQTGPGGVGTNTGVAPLQLWLRADAITPIPVDGTATPFVDASGNNRNSTSATQATYQSNVRNTFPIVRFNGTTMSYDNAYSYAARTVFVVYRVNSVTQPLTLGQLWGNDAQAHVAINPTGAAAVIRGFSFNGSTTQRGRYGLNGAAFTGFATDINTQQWTNNNFFIASVEFENTQNMTNQRISLAGNRFGGDLAEIIVYDRVLNNAERIVVQNYLSSKYNIALSLNDFYSHDATTAQPFFHDVAGVGKETLTNVHLASATSLVEINAVTTINSNSYLFMGHDNGTIGGYSIANSPTSYERVGRTWRADVTGTIGTVTFRVDVSQLPGGAACQLAILTDGDNNFTSGATVTPLTQVGVSSIYQATLAIPDNSYFTIGRAIGNTVTLTATATGVSGQVGLTWTNPALANFQEYRIYGGLSNNPNNLLATIPSQATLTTTLTGLVNCRLYYFRLVPVTNTNVQSPCEGRDTATPIDNTAPTPASLNLTAATPVVLPSANGQVTLTFNPSGDPDIRQIRVYRYPSTGSRPVTPTFTFTSGIDETTTQVVVAGLFTAPPATPVITCYEITQVDKCGNESAFSNQRCATVTRQPEICSNSIDDDGDGNIDCGDPDCAGVDNCAGCIFQITDPGIFQLFQYKIIPVQGNNIGYQTPIFGDVDNDGQTEIVVLGDGDANGTPVTISVLNPRNDALPAVEYFQTGLRQPASATSLLAMANVDGDAYIEFFYAKNSANSPLVCYQYNYDLGVFQLQWESDDPLINPIAAQRVSNTSRANVNIADFNQDGIPEVYCGGTIFNARTGRWLGYVGAGNPDGEPRENGGAIFHVSNAANVLTAADLIDTNADGIVDSPCGTPCNGLELLAGNVIYSVDSVTHTLVIRRTAPVPLDATFRDAVMSVADMDNDGDIDAVVAGYGRVYVWDIQDTNPVSTMLSNVFDLRGLRNPITNALVGSTTSLFSGVATINNFDKTDTKLEFALTKGLGVGLFNFIDNIPNVPENLVPLWTLGTSDVSGATGLSSFEFLGDGEAYLVYRDETTVRVFRGSDGFVYFDSGVAGFGICASNTGVELPTIGDVNNDGQTEIVATCNGRVIVYQSSNTPWLPSRNVWNQVNYNITNINGDLTVPAIITTPNYLTVAPPLNNYMAQRPLSNSTIPFIPSADIVALVDVDDDGINLGNCPAEVTFTLDITNQGDADVIVQYPITFYSGNPQLSSWTKLSTFTVSDGLAVDEQKEYTYSFPLTSDPAQVYVVLNDNGLSPTGSPIVLPNTSVAECEYKNNFLGPYVVSKCFDPLPITLIYFNGKDETDKVRLNWATTTEKNNAYFEIQRSFDGQEFVTIDVIEGQKFSNQTREYQTFDYENWIGTAYYRLKQVDLDGTPTLSNTIVFKRNTDLEINIYPNPISAGQDLNIEGLSGQWNAVLYDMAGRKIKNWTINFDKQVYTTPFPNLGKGMYIIQLEPLSNKEQGKIIEKIIVE